MLALVSSSLLLCKVLDHDAYVPRYKALAIRTVPIYSVLVRG